MSRAGFNPKRRIGHLDPAARGPLAESIRYGGNPEHKRNPGDFGLDPPASPRPDKTLCDVVEVFDRERALEFLKAGVLRGLVSAQWHGRFPQNIWSVTDSGEPLEAQLENRETGQYHGYPMPANDPFREMVEKALREAGP